MSCALPINQLDALPIMGALRYAPQGGTTIVVPGRVRKYWSPAQLGISAWPCNYGDPLPPYGFLALSNVLDLRGCTDFTMTATMVMREPTNDRQLALSVRMQALAPADGTVTVLPPTGNLGTPMSSTVASCQLNISSYVWPAGPPWPVIRKTASCGWSVGGKGSGIATQSGLTGLCRLWLSAASGVGGTIFNCLLYVSLMAESKRG